MLRINRGFSLSLVVLTATPWAAVMIVGGLWVLLSPDASRALAPILRFALGVTGIAAGQLVFLCLVADRVFPMAHRRMVWWFEIFSSMIVFGGFAWLLVLGASALAA
ncbi:MAG: hypothetical protein AAGG07_01550 [Planctomycetota bacterium]